MNLTAGEIAQNFAAWRGQYKIPEKPLAGISTDSRSIKRDDLFVAIKGDKFDGHDYVKQAINDGALAALVQQEWLNQQPKEVLALPILSCNDVLETFQETSRFYKKKNNVKTVALTGSAGKTTCKEFLFSVLSQKYNVLKNEKSFNNHIGVPLTLFKLEPEHEILVAELGTSNFGEIERLSYLVEPDVCLLLNIGYAHFEFFKSLEGVARAKMEIFAYASKQGTAFYNADDDILPKQKFPEIEKISFSLEKDSNFKGQVVSCDEYGRYTFNVLQQNITLKIPGFHNVYNALAAAVIGYFFGLSGVEIKTGLEQVEHIDHRMQMNISDKFLIVDDAYNANPGSCKAALATVADIKKRTGRRLIVVLGDMLELGEFSYEEHQKLAREVQQYRVDALYLFGKETKNTFDEAVKIKLKSTAHFFSQNELIEELIKNIKKNDLILVKGSRSMHMENVVRALKQD